MEKNVIWTKNLITSTFACTALMVMSTSRTAFALVTIGALVWVYMLSALVCFFARPILPEKVQKYVHIFLAAFFSCLYQFFLFLLNPILAMETSLFVFLTPVGLISSAVLRDARKYTDQNAFFLPLWECLALSMMILGIALIREPLGYGSLSVPGSVYGIVEIISSEDGPYFPVQFAAQASGALLILGFAYAIYRSVQNQKSQEEDAQ
ncbi:MAG: hypothetical protein LBM77_02680 [Spirochaetaceae bacterium]|jgi:Na+-transporting NADH:ubiquinone oxidoreductase subunit NqrD|nr:hypothetical protein [Spirochaetaceae bacterium]